MRAVSYTHLDVYKRQSLGRYNTEEDVEYALQVIPQVVERLREMSPVWQEMKEQGLVE